MNILIALALLIVLVRGESEMLREQRELHENGNKHRDSGMNTGKR